MSQEKGHLGSVAVLGAGTMGHGIAQVFAAAGSKVRLYDVDLGRIEKGRAQIESGLQRVAAKGKITAEEVARITGAITPATDLGEAVTGVELVVEAVPEDMTLKVELFKTVVAKVLLKT